MINHRQHQDCEGPTERGVCLRHLIGPYAAHCQVDSEPWPCEVVRLRRQLDAQVAAAEGSDDAD